MTKSLILIFLSIAIAVAGQLCLKAGMERVGRISAASLSRPLETSARVVTTPLVVLGLFFYALSAVFWLVVLSRVDLSFAYPMVGLSYILVLLFSSIFLGEQVGFARWIGAVIICVGVALIAQT